MSVLTKRTATCDVCKETEDFNYTSSDLPGGWEEVCLYRRVTDNSRRVHHLDLCPRCQEVALDVLGLTA